MAKYREVSREIDGYAERWVANWREESSTDKMMAMLRY